MNILTNDFVKPEGQRELARFGLAKNRTFKNDFVKPEGQRELARFGLARTDDKPRGEAEFTQAIPRREGRRRKSTDDKSRGEDEFTQTIPRREGRRRSQIALLRTIIIKIYHS